GRAGSRPGARRPAPRPPPRRPRPHQPGRGRIGRAGGERGTGDRQRETRNEERPDVRGLTFPVWRVLFPVPGGLFRPYPIGLALVTRRRSSGVPPSLVPGSRCGRRGRRRRGGGRRGRPPRASAGG